MNKKTILFIGVVFFLSYLSFHKAFGFDLWRDDWSQIWGAVFYQNYLWHGPAIHLHPISAYEQLLLGPLFKFNYFYWEIVGYLLRVADALVLSYMVFGITKSKKTAVFSGFIFAATLAGIEANTWISAQTSAIDFLFIAPGIFFWIVSESEHSLKKYLFAIIFFVLSTWADPGRGILVIGISLLWSILTIIQQLSPKTLSYEIKRVVPLLLVFYILQKMIASTGHSIFQTVISTWHIISIHPSVLLTIVNSIGNLLMGWIIVITDNGGLSNPSFQAYDAGMGFFTVSLVCGIFFLLKRSQTSKILLFFIVWIWIFYIPNWLFDMNLVVGTSHRYLMLSAIGLSATISIILSKLNQKIGISLLGVIILLNIQSSNRILLSEAYVRSAIRVEPIWTQIDRDVPKGEMNDIFVYGGNDPIRGPDLDWSGGAPFGIKRKFKNIDDFPIMPVNDQMIIDLVCGKKILRPSIGQWSLQKIPIPLSHVHAWNLDNGILTNVSVKKRKLIKSMLNCTYRQ